MYYIEGTLDVIELEAPGLKLKQFSLLPSSEYLLAMPDGEKKALFIEFADKQIWVADKKQACLIGTSKNSGGKQVVVFKSSSSGDSALSSLLIQAKRDRVTIRVCVKPAKNKRSNATPYPSVEDVAEIHLV